jgi:Homeodomain-like domain
VRSSAPPFPRGTAGTDQGGRQVWTDEQRVRALGLVDAGWLWAQAGREFGVAKTTVGTWVRKRQLAA